MIAFLLFASVLLAGVLIILLRPLLKQAVPQATSARSQQTEATLLVLREHLAELENERAAARLTEADFELARTELEQRALAEGVSVEPVFEARPALALAYALLVAIPLVVFAGYFLLFGEPDALDPAKHLADPAHQMNSQQMSELVAKLADRLDADPSDANGWSMLARSYALLNDTANALSTWQRIGSKIPDDAMALTDWADILVAAHNGRFDGEPERLIAKALQIEPNNIKGLALAGTAAFLRHDFVLAISYWERILPLLSSDDPMRASVEASIAESRQQAALPANSAPVAETSLFDASSLRLRGTVHLSEALAARVRPEQSVFVFVRSALSSGSPLAAIRLKVADLPASFDFSEAVIMQNEKLPAQLLLIARLSQQGDASARSGDFESASLSVTADGENIDLVIDRVRE